MTDEEPHGLFRRKVVEAGGFWQIAWLFFTQGFQMASQSLIRMGISQSFDLAPELLHVVTSLIPTSHDICLVRIKTTSMLMVVVRFHIFSLRERGQDAHRSRFACAVGAKDAQDRSFLGYQVQPVQGM